MQIFYKFCSTLGSHKYSKLFLIEDRELFILHGQYQAAGGLMTQGARESAAVVLT